MLRALWICGVHGCLADIVEMSEVKAIKFQEDKQASYLKIYKMFLQLIVQKTTTPF